MNGKDIFLGLKYVGDDLIENAEFDAFQKSKVKTFGKKKLLLLLAAVLIMGTMTAATFYTRWSATMQLGNYGGVQPSEQIKSQAEKTGLTVVPTKTKGNKQEAITATDNGITVTVVQTLADQYGGRVIFRIEGLELEDGQAPWAWWDFLIDGQPLAQSEYGVGLGAHFFDGITTDSQGNPIYIKNGQPISKEGEHQEWVMDYQLSDGSIEYCVDLEWIKNSLLGKEVTFSFTGFGIQGDTKYDEENMTVPGKWELTWTLEGYTGEPKKWTPNTKIGDLPMSLSEVEIGQYSMKITYQMDEQVFTNYADFDDFQMQNAWNPHPAGVRLKDGTDIYVNGRGIQSLDSEHHQYTVILCSLATVLDPEQIAGISFYPAYELDEQSSQVEKPHYYIPLE